MHRLVFHNPRTVPKDTSVGCSIDDVPYIMAWYGFFHAGDLYTVTLNGRNVPMDMDGEPTTIPCPRDDEGGE